MAETMTMTMTDSYFIAGPRTPFAATGARILSPAVKELSAMGPGRRAIVSVCAHGGQGTVALLEPA